MYIVFIAYKSDRRKYTLNTLFIQWFWKVIFFYI